MNVIKNEDIELALDGCAIMRGEIVEKLEPLIRSSISKYYYRARDFEDLVQDGRLEVLECFDSFDKGKRVHFLGYVKTRLRYLYLNKNRIVEEESVENSDGTSMLDFLSSEVDVEGDLIEKEELKFLKEALDSLSPKEKETIIDFYLKEMSLGEIADEKCLSYSTVNNNKVRALKKLRKFYKNR